MNFFAAVPTNLHLFYCAVSSTTCTLTDTGYAYNAIPNADLANSAITIAGTSVSLGGSTSSLPSPGAIGGTTPSTGAFTTLTATTSVAVGSSVPAACGSASGCLAFNDSSAAGTPTSAQSYIYVPTSTSLWTWSLNGASETSVWSAAQGGSGVANTATHTLGTSNQNWATLGTGIVKNTTTTGAISDAASSDVISLWTETCSSSTFLRGDGSCQAAGGSISFPQTVAGTTTSGGIPYFSNTTTLTSSGILNTNILVKGGGAGGAPTNSSITDNGTTVATTEPVSVGSSPPTCTPGTAGALCQGTGTGPTSASGVGDLWPNSLDNNYYYNVNAGTTQHLQQTASITSAYTNATTGATNITGLSFAVAASTIYNLHCYGLAKAASTGGLELTVTGPSTPTNVSYSYHEEVTLSAGVPTYNDFVGTGTSYPSGVGVAYTTTTTDMPFDFWMQFSNGSTSGTLQLQGKSAAAVTTTVEIGATCTLQ